MNVRRARAGDAPTLADHCMAVALESEGIQLDRATVESAVQAGLHDDAKAMHWVAEMDAVVGSLAVTREWSDWRNGWNWWIQSLYVEPEFRGLGIAGRLMDAVEDAAAAAGALNVRLHAHRSNPANSLYQRRMDPLDYVAYSKQL